MFRIPVRPDLELRLAVYSHAEEVFEAVQANRAHLAAWLPWVDQTHSAADIVDWIRRGLEQFARNEGWQAVLWHQDRVAGALGFKTVDWASMRVEMGYWLAERLQGKGLMTAAARAATDYAFSEWRMNRVEIRCSVDNVRSAAIPRRLGFEQEGMLRQAFRVGDVYQDLLLFGMLREKWGELQLAPSFSSAEHVTQKHRK
jgi:ribosomal-protein-serine acetyltransferase